MPAPSHAIYSVKRTDREHVCSIACPGYVQGVEGGLLMHTTFYLSTRFCLTKRTCFAGGARSFPLVFSLKAEKADLSPGMHATLPGAYPEHTFDISLCSPSKVPGLVAGTEPKKCKKTRLAPLTTETKC